MNHDKATPRPGEDNRCMHIHLTWRSPNGKRCKMQKKVGPYCTRHAKLIAEEKSRLKELEADHA